LYEDDSFPERRLAALVASKIYYHLQAYDESMIFALGAGKLFDIDQEGEFEDTIIGLITSFLRASISRLTKPFDAFSEVHRYVHQPLCRSKCADFQIHVRPSSGRAQ